MKKKLIVDAESEANAFECTREWKNSSACWAPQRHQQLVSEIEENNVDPEYLPHSQNSRTAHIYMLNCVEIGNYPFRWNGFF